MKNSNIENRQDNEARQVFNSAYTNLKDVLSCYDKQFHYDIISAYIKTYKEYDTLTMQAKSRLYFMLGAL